MAIAQFNDSTATLGLPTGVYKIAYDVTGVCTPSYMDIFLDVWTSADDIFAYVEANTSGDFNKVEADMFIESYGQTVTVAPVV